MGVTGRGRRVAAALVLGAAVAPYVLAQDRPVHVLDTDPAPAAIEGGTFFLVGGQVALSVRNRHSGPIQVTLRAWVFDQAGRLKGTQRHCTPEWLERGTRRVVSVSLAVRDLLATDNVTVAVEEAVAVRQRWRVAAAPLDAVAQARGAAGVGGRLRLNEVSTAATPSVPCPCECPTAADECDVHCAATGLAAFTCSPVVFDGCSASCSCK